MRGDDRQERALFSYVVPEARIPTDHPLRALRPMVDAVVQELSAAFAALYARTGRPSIPPERPLRALLLQILYTVRSERLLMEQLDYNILFRWFVGLNLDDPIWDPTVFAKNRDRLLAGEIAQAFLTRSSPRPGDGASFPMSTSPWTAPSSRLGPARRASRGRRADAPAHRPRQSDRELPGGAPEQRHPRLDHGPRRPPRQEGPRPGREAGLPGPRSHGQPPRARGCRPGDRGDGHRRTGGRARARATRPPPHPRRGRGVRHPRIRSETARPPHHPARGPEHQRPRQCH